MSSELELESELELSDEADELESELEEASDEELELSADELFFDVLAVAAACVYVDKTFCNVESLMFTFALPNSSPTIA